MKGLLYIRPENEFSEIIFTFSEFRQLILYILFP